MVVKKIPLFKFRQKVVISYKMSTCKSSVITNKKNLLRLWSLLIVPVFPEETLIIRYKNEPLIR